jgi:hypothetical protein
MNTEHQAALLEMFQLYGHETLSAAINQRHYYEMAERVKAEVAAQKQARDAAAAAVPKVGDIYYDGKWFRLINRIMNKTYEYKLIGYHLLDGEARWNRISYAAEKILDWGLRDKLRYLDEFQKYDGTPIDIKLIEVDE